MAKIKRIADGILLSTAFQEYLTEKINGGIVPDTVGNYRSAFRRLSAFLEEEYPEIETVEELTKRVVNSYIKYMGEREISPNSVNSYLSSLRAFLYWCMDEEQGYLEKYTIKNIASVETKVKYFTDEELMLLLEKPRRSSRFTEWRAWAITNFIMGTAARSATIRAVQIRDIDFDKKSVFFRHTKSKKKMELPLSSALESVLKEYIRSFLKDFPEDTPLFPNSNGEMLSSAGLRQNFKVYCKMRDVDHSNIHGLRHAFARGFILNDGNPSKLQRVLGHSTPQMTQRYITLFAEDLKEDFDSYSPLDTLKKKTSRKPKIK